MAYATPRSANAELLLGTAEGGYKAVVKDRGGAVEMGAGIARSDLDCKFYALHEAPVWDSPDCRPFTPVIHTPTPCPENHG